MNNLLSDMARLTQFLHGYGLDQKYWICFPQDYQPQCFKLEIFGEIRKQLHVFLKNGQVEEQIRLLPVFDIDLELKGISEFVKIRDAKLLRIILEDLMHVFILEQKRKGKKTEEIVVPARIGVPLLKVSEFLGIKFGTILGYEHHWRVKGQPLGVDVPEDFNVDTFEKVYFYTEEEHHKDETIFLFTNFAGAFHVFRAITVLLQLHFKIEAQPQKGRQFCEQVLKYVKKCMTNLVKYSLEMIGKKSPKFLMDQFRDYIGSFSNIRIQGMEDRRFSCAGGSGGIDPCFQLFQSILAISLPQRVVKIREIYRVGFTSFQRKLIADMQTHCYIRGYCELDPKLKQSYNQVVELYGNFFQVHAKLIKKFVVEVSPTTRQGVMINTEDFEELLVRETKIYSHKIESEE